METITYTQVQELVNQLPARKLPLIYNLLVDLADKELFENSPQFDIMSLSLNEKHQILKQQAEQMIAHYKQTTDDRLDWQAGGFVDEY